MLHSKLRRSIYNRRKRCIPWLEFLRSILSPLNHEENNNLCPLQFVSSTVYVRIELAIFISARKNCQQHSCGKVVIHKMISIFRPLFFRKWINGRPELLFRTVNVLTNGSWVVIFEKLSSQLSQYIVKRTTEFVLFIRSEKNDNNIFYIDTNERQKQVPDNVSSF